MPIRTIVYFNDVLLGYLFNDADYAQLGGEALVDVFAGHHVQLVRTRGGHIKIVDDINSHQYHYFTNVRIYEERHSSGRWWPSANQCVDVDEYVSMTADQLREAIDNYHRSVIRHPHGGYNLIDRNIEEYPDPAPQEYIRRNDAAQARADRIADAFTCNGIKLRRSRKGGVRDDIFYHCFDHPDLPDSVITEWLAQAHAASAAKRRQLWKRILQAHGK